MRYVLAIDQGTTSTRAIIFDKDLEIVASSQKEIEQFFQYFFEGYRLYTQNCLRATE